MDLVGQIGFGTFNTPISRLVLAGLLGLFLGLEREWSEKPAGIRTFSLISLLAAVFWLLGQPWLLVIGGLLVIVLGAILATDGLIRDNVGFSLTTSVSMLVAYGVGALVAADYLKEGVTVAVLSSLLLVLKRELHHFANNLSRKELRSTTGFAILAFVIYPLLPTGELPLRLGRFTVAIEPRVIWLMVVAVAGIGIINYAVVTTYGGRGVAVTGFMGGLASSTAVVGTTLDQVRRRENASAYAVAAILLADAAMALRNLLIVVGFTITDGLLFGAAIPLAIIVLGAFVIAALIADWGEPLEINLESPFSLRNALSFGAIFAVVLVVGGLAEAQFGAAGLYITAALSGLVSSAGATTSTVALYRTGDVPPETAILAILVATLSSIFIKITLTSTSPNRRFAIQVALWSVVLMGLGTVAAVMITLF
ncbi:MgtC/SapB family protein [Halococcus sp. IIIV-5B]|uniref:MgtC/SapB family protein n=1 Tax=Halococcus sp. IIIV-5B TaxID=2321230 RepID=UPI0018F718FB|nr:MgtC/SapB family protein [Halococcus sp. IIIV-5B]